MPSTRPRSLRDALAGADPRARIVSRDGLALALSDMAAGTRLGPMARRRVMLVTETQASAALALADLDGIAQRILLCPPDLKAADWPVVAALAEIDAVVTDRDPALFETLGLPCVPCGPSAESPRQAAPPFVRTEWVLMTSGTTGVPKMVIHTLDGLTAAIALQPKPATPSVWATFYDIRRYGGLQIFLRAMLGQSSLVLSAVGEPIAEHLARLGAAGVTHISGTPSHWRRALMSPEATRMAPRYIRLSGEIADQTILDHLKTVFPRAAIGHAYASTEAGVGFDVNDGLAGFPADLLNREDGEVRMKVEDGSLRIRSNRTASRYIGEDAPNLVEADGFVDTGDMVEQRGDRCYFAGRRGGIINVGGLKVHPEEVEAVINRHPSVKMSLVKARRSPITGAIVVADVVLSETDASGHVKTEILQACQSSLAVHKVPAAIRFVPSLAVTAAGKLARPHA